MAEYIATPALVLKSMIDIIKSEIPSKYVYDENLDYQSAITKIRSDNSMNTADSLAMPVFVFNRSVLRMVTEQAPGIRSRYLTAKSDPVVNNTVNIYKMPYAQFDVNFLYVAKEMSNLEMFEISYLAENGLTAVKTFTVDTLSQIGVNLEYYPVYGEMSDKRLELDGVYYKTITGMITIRGFFPILTGTAKTIADIKLTIQSFYKEMYFTQIIPNN